MHLEFLMQETSQLKNMERLLPLFVFCLTLTIQIPPGRVQKEKVAKTVVTLKYQN